MNRLLILCGAGLILAGCSRPVALAPAKRGTAYSARNLELAEAGAQCARAGEVQFADAFDTPDVWEARSYEKRMVLDVGVEKDGVKGLHLTGATNKCDTAWRVGMKTPQPLKTKGSRFLVTFGVRTDRTIFDPGHAKWGWNNAIFWYDAAGKEIGAQPLGYMVSTCRDFTSVRVTGDIPSGAAKFAVLLGGDSPNFGPGESAAFRDFRVEVLPEAPRVAAEARFVSEVRAGGGEVAWDGLTPPGTAIRFRLRASADPKALFAKSFVGPDGTANTYFEKPFAVAEAYLQYEAVLVSDGKATPTLQRVYAPTWTDAGWTFRADGHPPYVSVTSPTPTTNPRETLRLTITEDSAVDWNTFHAQVDGVESTAAFRRMGNSLALEGRAEAWATGVHTVDVQVADCHGNVAKTKKFFFIGEAPKTPRYTLRDDGVVLVDGKPFFPIGPYAVCRREFNGMNLDKAFGDLKAGGFNFAHTYGNSYDPEFLAAAEKHGFKLWVQARFPSDNFINVGRHHPSILAWYLGDDTSEHITAADERDYHDACKALDPTRLTCQADPIASSQAISRYADYVTATDVFMPEIYPVRAKLGDKTDRTCVAETIRDMACVRSDVLKYGDGKPRSCWPIIQYFKGWSGWGHFPTREQLDAMTWAAVIHGAHGMTWYTYGGFVDKKRNRINEGITSTPERWRNICTLATRLRDLSDVITARKGPQPPVPEVVKGEAKDPLGQPAVTCLLKRHGGKTYLFAVNAAPSPVTARFALAGEKGSARVLWEDGRTCALADGFTDDFAAFGVHVYCW